MVMTEHNERAGHGARRKKKTKERTKNRMTKPYEKCESIYTKDPLVNEAMDANYRFVVKMGWSRSQLELFLAALRRLHTTAMGSVEWNEARLKRLRKRKLRKEN
jgi:hypothetical protein